MRHHSHYHHHHVGWGCRAYHVWYWLLGIWAAEAMIWMLVGVAWVYVLIFKLLWLVVLRIHNRHHPVRGPA
jgi:hypothetical protein